jgi:hypothetical protein
VRVDFGFFKGDELLQRGAIVVTERENSASYGMLAIKHRLLEDMAEITIEAFSDAERLMKSTLHMPIHESDDWESIELAEFTLAFRCSLNA